MLNDRRVIPKSKTNQKVKMNLSKTQLRILAAVAVAVIVAVIALVLTLTLGRGPKTEEPVLLSGKHYVEINIADYGVITAELDADVAPITVTNFMKLVNEGFYDGLTFHRIISGFMIQGGDPVGNGTGGSPYSIKGEFAANGVANPIVHERGVLSMARSSSYNSASSQFFIMHQKAPHLDGLYAAFGYVISGMEVVDAICARTPVVDGNGTVPNGYKPVITSIRQIEKP